MRMRSVLCFMLILLTAQTPAFAQDAEETSYVPGKILWPEAGRVEVDGAGKFLLDFCCYGSGLEVADYRDVEVLIEELPQSIQDTGLTEGRIRTRLESRFTSVGLSPLNRRLDRSADHFLYVGFGGYGNAFDLNLAFVREVSYFLPNPTGERYLAHYKFARTWPTGTIGTHSGNAGFILESLDEHLDKFVNEYLMANAP